MTKFLPYHVLLSYEKVEYENSKGYKFTRKEPRIRVFKSANEALRQHALAYQNGVGGMLELEPPIADHFDISAFQSIVDNESENAG